MRITQRIKIIALIAIFIWFMPQWHQFANAQIEKKPNIILIMADDLGYEGLSVYGSKDYKTPNLDYLANTGIRFENCYSTPVCTPSRIQIMTGRYGHRNYVSFGYLNPKEITFANLLQKVGYRTCIAGKWQLSGDDKTVRGFGFDEYLLWNMYDYAMEESKPNAKEPKREEYKGGRRYWNPKLYKNGQWVESVKNDYGPDLCTNFILSFIKKHRDEPFFVYYPMLLPHIPFIRTPDSTYKGLKRGPWAKDFVYKIQFTDMVQYIDKIVGKIVAYLEVLEIRENTLILFTADNGTDNFITSNTIHEIIKGGKGFSTDSGTRVPLIANWPNTTPKGEVNDDLIDLSDFLPTIVELSGASLPGDRILDGRSFANSILGRKIIPREWIYCYYVPPEAPEKRLTVSFIRDKRWKLYLDGKVYDLKNDPQEKASLQILDQPAKATISKFTTVLKSLYDKK